jgi:hypothetical protein
MSKFSTVMITTLLALAVSVPCFAQDVTHGAPYLRMGVGPRALAMGGAFVAAADDVTAGYWNPAGLMEVDWIEAQIMYSQMDLDRNYNYFAYAHHFDFGAIGMGWINSGTDDLKLYGSDGVADGTDDWSDNALMLSYGTGLAGFYVGGSAKILMSEFGNESDTGFGVDASVRFVPSSKLAIGVMIQDIGTQYWDEAVGTNVRAGIALKSGDENLLIAADAEKRADEEIIFHLGAELGFCYTPGNFAALRAGVQTGGEQSDEDMLLSFGAGLWIGQVSFDYAYLPEKQDFMDSSHRISLTGRF